MTFEQFKDEVMTTLEDWPLRFKDLDDNDYSFETVGGLGYSGEYINRKWYVYDHGLGRKGSGNTLESAFRNSEVKSV